MSKPRRGAQPPLGPRCSVIRMQDGWNVILRRAKGGGPQRDRGLPNKGEGFALLFATDLVSRSAARRARNAHLRGA